MSKETTRATTARARALRDARRNRKAWDADSDEYQEEHGAQLEGDKGLAWGLWRIPEDSLDVLGEVKGKDILELGCGAGQWSLGLCSKGARPIGMDNSGEQLRHARRLMQKASVGYPIVQADAELVPFKDESFDIVFCDYGAMSFADPALTIPEASRVLRPGGLLAFSTTTPFLQVCWPDEEEEVTTTLHSPYFGMRRAEWTADDTVDYQVPYGEWIRLFRANGMIVENLIEVRPEKNATTTFPGRPLSWARRWPAENIWKARKEP